MNSPWGSGHAAERYAVPVEMRFIDMFMAALGALLFMAMLFAFLLKYLPSEGKVPSPTGPEGSQPGALRLLTRTLTPAQAGEPYEFAFAYRGGTGAIAWDVAAGSQEIPAGMRFDAKQGILTGTPKSPRTVRFVLRVRDTARRSDERPYELIIEPFRKSSRGYERWLATGVLVLVSLVWLLSFISASQLKSQVVHLKQAYESGQLTIEWETGRGVVETIQLPSGLDTYQTRLRGMQQFNRYWLIGIVVLSVWLIWRFWLS